MPASEPVLLLGSRHHRDLRGDVAQHSQPHSGPGEDSRLLSGDLAADPEESWPGGGDCHSHSGSESGRVSSGGQSPAISRTGAKAKYSAGNNIIFVLS